MELVNIIKYICYTYNINPNLERDIIIQDDGSGPYIKEWNLSIPRPSLPDMLNLEEEAQRWVSNSNYIKLRTKEYPTIQDQLDMLYWDRINGTTTWVDKITEIKEKYPKS